MTEKPKLVTPYPFNEKMKHEKIYAKFSEFELNKEKSLHWMQISLITESQLKYDAFYLSNTSDFLNDYNYYVYEFIGDCPTQLLIEKKISSDQLYEISFIEEDEVHSESLTIEGHVLYAASPVQRKRKSLVVGDKADDDINEAVKRHFSLKPDTEYNDKSDFSRMPAANLFKMIENIPQNWHVKIVNVGQGNCIFIDNPKANVRFTLDIGYSCFETLPAAEANIKKYAHELACVKDSFVALSHWDLDHILGVCFVDNKDFFRKSWLTPEVNVKSSIAARRLAKYVERMGKLIALSSKFNGKSVYNATSGNMSIWKGDPSAPNTSLSNENNRGLIMALAGFKKPTYAPASSTLGSMLLPGDCEYAAMPDVVRTGRYQYLITPHHGSKMTKPDFAPAGPYDMAIFLCGESVFQKVSNPHPNVNHIHELAKIGYVTTISTRATVNSNRLQVIFIR